MNFVVDLDAQTCELLRAIARPSAQDDRRMLEEIVAKIPDWDAVISGARWHGVLPMLFSRLTSNQVSIPESALERIKAANDRNILQNLSNAAELLDVLAVFEAEGIPAMPFKGVVFGASVYKDIATRPAGDLDLLIFRRDLTKATEILLSRGYSLTTSVPDQGSPEDVGLCEYHFERQSDGMVTELRWRMELTQPRFRRDLGMDWVWERRQFTTLAGARVPDLDTRRALLVLSMHGSKHRWSRLIWICDVAQLIERHPDLEWREVIREAKRFGLWRALALGVLLAHRVALAPVPEPVLRRFEADRVAGELARHFDENVIHQPGSVPTGGIPYMLRLLGPTDRVGMVLSGNLLQPNSRDRALIGLPRFLDPLYYLIRPIRILLDRTAR